MRKPAFCICEKKVQISCTDQRLSFRYTVQFLCYLNLKFQTSSHHLWLNSPVVSDLVGNHKDSFLMKRIICDFQPRDVLCGAADEVLSVLKNDRMREKEKKKEVEGLLGSIAEERFALLVNLGKKITDWTQEEKMQTGDLMFGLLYYTLS